MDKCFCVPSTDEETIEMHERHVLPFKDFIL